MNQPPVLRIIPGGLIDTVVTATATPDSPRLAQDIVRAAQSWAAAMLEHRIVDQIDLSTDAGRVTLVLLDCVMQLEYWMTSPVVATQGQDPATLW